MFSDVVGCWPDIGPVMDTRVINTVSLRLVPVQLWISVNHTPGCLGCEIKTPQEPLTGNLSMYRAEAGRVFMDSK